MAAAAAARGPDVRSIVYSRSSPEGIKIIARKPVRRAIVLVYGRSQCVCACVHAWMRATVQHVACMHARIHTHSTQVERWTHQVSARTRTALHIHAFKCIHVCICVHVRVYIHMRVCIYLCICIRMCICVCVYTRTHTGGPVKGSARQGAMPRRLRGPQPSGRQGSGGRQAARMDVGRVAASDRGLRRRL